MSRRFRHRPRRALWRVVVWCVLVALVVFAPVARAVCDLQHVAAAAQLHQGGWHGDPADRTPLGGNDACCGGGLVAMTPQSAIPADAGLNGSACVLHAAVPSARGVAPAPIAAAAGGPAPPYEPIFRLLPKLLI